jgi:hypothetical protein
MKRLIQKIKKFYDNEYEWKISIEFSIYDIIGLLLLIIFIWKMLNK